MKHSVRDLYENTYTCEFCQSRFQNESNLKRHTQSHIKTRLRSKKHQRSHKPLELFSCDICFKQFMSSTKLFKHEFTHQEKKLYSCEFCLKQYRTYNGFKNHKNKSPCNKLSCNICQERFSDSLSLIHHQHICNKVKIYSCNICLIQFESESRLKNHYEAHRIQNTSNSQLSKHKKTFSEGIFLGIDTESSVAKEKPYRCVVCNKVFTEKQKLATHSLCHTSEDFVCEICKASFSRKATLDKHCYIHSDNKPFACSVCPRKFIRRTNMIIHYRMMHKNCILYYNESDVYIE